MAARGRCAAAAAAVLLALAVCGVALADDAAARAAPASAAAVAAAPAPAQVAAPLVHLPSHDHPPSRLFQHFDADSDGLLSEKEVAALLKLLTRKRRDEDAAKAAAQHAAGEARAAGVHDITIDGETLSVGDGDFELLFKQLSNLKQTKDPSKDPRMTLQEDIVFVKDLVIVFLAATLGGLVATHFRQPALIGFLLGGMTVGPGGMGAVTELVEVETLASLGIAFLLFSLGIEFSLSELQSVRRVVVVGGTLSMFLIVLGAGGFSVALNLVQGVSEAIALGLAISLSSTAVVLQCLPTEHTSPALDKAAIARAAGAIPTVSTVSTSHARSPAAPRRPVNGNNSDERSTSGTQGTGKGANGGSRHHKHPSGTGTVAASATDAANGRTREASSVPDTAALTSAAVPAREDEASIALYPLEMENAKVSGILEPESSHAPASGFDAPRSRKVMLGLLVFQDVMIGLILALLPTLKGTTTQFFEELLSASLRLGCFVVLSLILADFVLPTLTDRVDKARSQEVFTISCVVFCLAMAYVSERMGLAIELGAFAAGIMLSESRHKARVEDAVEGIRTVFSAIFFISVGMMIHWRYFYQNFVKMLLLLFIVLLTKAVVFACIIFALGKLPIRTAVACGAAIAQAGEFTFVVASKGQSLLLFSSSEARMINGATALSMLLSPYIISSVRRWSMRASGRAQSSSSS